MDAVQTATLQTIIYADIFDFALNSEEIHRYLLYHLPVSLEQVQQALCSEELRSQILTDDNYFALQTNHHAIQRRHASEQVADQFWKQASYFARWLAAIPFVEMVALTGALAMRNPGSERDDFDFLIVAHPGRVWFVRACSVLLVRGVRLFGNEICPNYILASDQLRQKRQDLFIAHEIAQMRPLFGWKIYRRMLQENQWTRSMLANAAPFSACTDHAQPLKRLLEWLLSGAFGDLLDRWEYNRRARKLRLQALHPQSAAVIDHHHVKGHFHDHGTHILEAYETRIRDFDLPATTY